MIQERTTASTTIAPMPRARSSFALAVDEGRIFAIGGHAGGQHRYGPEDILADICVYDPNADRWDSLAPLPRTAQGFQAVASGGYIYAFGGFGYEVAADGVSTLRSSAAIDRYDIAADRWEPIGALDCPRSSYGIAVAGDRAWLFGGWSVPPATSFPSGTFLDHVSVFDLAQETVAVAPFDLPIRLRAFDAALTSDGETIALGGLGAESAFDLSDATLGLSPLAATPWRDYPNLPRRAFGPAAGIIGRTLVAAGGLSLEDPDHFDAVRILNLDAPEAGWRTADRQLRTGRILARTAPLAGGALAVLGGHVGGRDGSFPTADCEVLEWL